jgi:hypothetical protein
MEGASLKNPHRMWPSVPEVLSINCQILGRSRDPPYFFGLLAPGANLRVPHAFTACAPTNETQQTRLQFLHKERGKGKRHDRSGLQTLPEYMS